MIIQLTGTNGAGKSSIVRTVMSLYSTPKFVVHHDPPRRRPIGYEFPSGCRHLFVAGHYEIDNGGIDTLPSLDFAYRLIRRYDDRNYDVLYEGKNLGHSPRRVVDLRDEGRDARVILVDYPVEACVAAVRARGHSISEKTIRRLHVKSYADAEFLRGAGVPTLVLPRVEALGQVREWLGL